LAISKNKGAAVSDPHCEVFGSFKITKVRNFGFETGAKPINEAIVFEGS